MKGYQAVHKNCLAAGESGWKQSRFQDSPGVWAVEADGLSLTDMDAGVIEHHWGFP